MKKITKILSLLLALVFAMTAFVACGGETVIIEEGGIDYVQVQWVWGQVVLKEEYVERGSYLTSWTPEADGREFEGWYQVEGVRSFKFEKTPITEPMRIYAVFKGGPVDIETEMPDWYLIGTGKGELLSKSAWQHSNSMQYLGMTAGEDGIYKITLELYAGDAFKMARNGSWADEDQRAIDKMAGFADGKVTDSAGNVIFTAGGNNNIVVADGQNGKYEITYDPNADQLGFTKLESLEEKPDDIRLIGSFNNWNQGTQYGENDYKFTSEDKVTWTYVWEAEAGAEFKVYNNISGSYYPDGEGNNLKITDAGTYTVTFNLKTQAIAVTDANGNTVDVGATGGNGGSSNYEGETIRIYFKNNWTWPQVNCHWWGSQAAGESQWPGNVMNKVEGSTDMYYLDVPADITGLLFNGQGSYGEDKSEDVKTGIFDGAAWEMLWDETTQTKTAIPITYAP